jgi:hypothetical protein
MLGITVIRMANLALINNFRDKWTLDCKIYRITNTKPYAGSRNDIDQTCFRVELTVSQQRVLKYVGRTYFYMRERVNMWQNRPCKSYSLV